MKKVLIVDDDADILSVVKYILTIHGFTVYTHSNGYGVLQIVKELKPDMILLDVMLPGKNGIEICKEIKQAINIPVILFTAHADKIKSLEEYEADDFIEKPFDIHSLVKTIKDNLNYETELHLK